MLTYQLMCRHYNGAERATQNQSCCEEATPDEQRATQAREGHDDYEESEQFSSTGVEVSKKLPIELLSLSWAGKTADTNLQA